MQKTILAALVFLAAAACGGPSNSELDNNHPPPLGDKLGTVKSAITYPWTSFYHMGYYDSSGGGVSTTTTFGPSDSICAVNNLAGPMANGSYVNINYNGSSKFVFNVHNGGHGAFGAGPTGGAVCTPVSAFSYVSAGAGDGTCPAAYPLYAATGADRATLSSFYSATTGHFTSNPFTDGIAGSISEIVTGFGGYLGSGFASGISLSSPPTVGSEALYLNGSTNCLTNNYQCGQTVKAYDYQVTANSMGGAGAPYDYGFGPNIRSLTTYKDYLISSTSGTTASTFTTTLNGEDGICFIASAGNNFNDGTTQAQTYVDSGTDKWVFSVIGNGTNARFSCLPFVQQHCDP